MSRNRWYGLALAALAIAVFAAGFVEAQQRKQRPGGFGGRGFGGGGGFQQDPVSLVQNANVQKEIELEGDQAKEVVALREEMDQELQEMRRKIAAKYQEKLGKALLPHQFERLQQISLQLRGNAALSDPEVAKKLGLSDDQLSQIAAKRKEGAAKQQELFGGGGGGGDFAERREKAQKIREETDEAIMSVLSSKQKEDYEKLKGKEIDVRSLFTPPGGGRKQRPDTE